jgi:hypothetical protein
LKFFFFLSSPNTMPETSAEICAHTMAELATKMEDLRQQEEEAEATCQAEAVRIAEEERAREKAAQKATCKAKHKVAAVEEVGGPEAGPSKRPRVEHEPLAEMTEAEGLAEGAVVEVDLPEVACGR